jgi:phosphoribosyl-ATP pyrophosphohydrolase/phosphoribosyl-AMP cyclohydrolase
MTDMVIHKVKFDERGLIPAILQNASTSEVIALFYMDNASLIKTLQTGKAEYVMSGATPTAARGPHRLVDVRVNSDGDSLTVLVEPEGPAPEPKTASLLADLEKASHAAGGEVSLVDVGSMELGLALHTLYSLISERKEKRPEGSYTTYLFNSGLDKILKKIAEESGEVIIAAKNKVAREITSELADLFYHLLVLMVERDIKLSDVRDELSRRAAPKK